LNEQMNAANMQIAQRVRDGEIDRSEQAALFEQNRKALDAEIKKVLTPEQDKKFTEMMGPKFTRDPKDDEAMRGARGGGRGGGLYSPATASTSGPRREVRTFFYDRSPVGLVDVHKLARKARSTCPPLTDTPPRRPLPETRSNKSAASERHPVGS